MLFIGSQTRVITSSQHVAHCSMSSESTGSDWRQLWNKIMCLHKVDRCSSVSFVSLVLELRLWCLVGMKIYNNVSVHDKKACKGSRSITPSILNLGTRHTWVVNFTLRPFTPVQVRIEQEVRSTPEPIWTFWWREKYEACPESIQPFWIFREPVVWPWRNLAASQGGPYCAAVISRSSVGLGSRQWDAVDWVSVLPYFSRYSKWLNTFWRGLVSFLYRDSEPDP